MDHTLRPFTPADLAAVHRLHRRIEEQDRIPLVTPWEEFADWLEDPHFDPAHDARLAEVEGEVVAWARIWHRPSGEREERAYLLGGVDATRRRQGIGSSLLRWQIERASRILRDATAHLPRFVRTNVYDFQKSALELYARHSLTVVRYGAELLRDLASLPPPPETGGVEIVRWHPARSEEARVSQNEAFADHWGSTPRDAAAWEHEISSFGTRLDLSFMALDQGRVVGVCRNGHFPGDEALSGRRDGWIMQLSVARSHRRRGIGAALIVASLEAFKAAGLTHSTLGVDSDNPTGATRLYERLGYRPLHRSITSQLQV